jgi:lipid-A-disaccharide synthase
VAPSIGEAAVRRLAPPDLDVRYLDGIAYDEIQAADAALVASGTATLELACLGIPMVVAYRGSLADLAQYHIIRLCGGLSGPISLPNILSEAFVVPELLQRAASPEGLATALRPLLSDGEARRVQLQAFTTIRGWLGDGHACERTARLVLRVGE